MTPRRAIPSIDRLLDRPALAAAIVRHGRQAVTDATRRAAEAWRASAGAAADETSDRIGDWIEAHVDIQKSGSRLAFANAYLVVGSERILRASAVFGWLP